MMVALALLATTYKPAASVTVVSETQSSCADNDCKPHLGTSRQHRRETCKMVIPTGTMCSVSLPRLTTKHKTSKIVSPILGARYSSISKRYASPASTLSLRTSHGTWSPHKCQPGVACFASSHALLIWVSMRQGNTSTTFSKRPSPQKSPDEGV